MTPARFSFISGHEFGHRCLSAMLHSDACGTGKSAEAILAVTVRPKPSVATVGLRSLTSLADTFGIRHESVSSIMDSDLRSILESGKPDFIVAIGLSQLLPPSLLDIPKEVSGSETRHSLAHGVIGMHPTLLPKGRGRAPIPWAIIRGLNETGVTAFFLEEEPDSGPIILQRRIPIDARETASTLFSRIGDLHEELAVQLVRLMGERRVSSREQDDTNATYWPRRRAEEGLIDFRNSVEAVDRLVRALTAPYPGAFFYYQGHKIMVYDVQPQQIGRPHQPGRIVAISANGYPVISCRDGLITVTRLRAEEPANFEIGHYVMQEHAP